MPPPPPPPPPIGGPAPPPPPPPAFSGGGGKSSGGGDRNALLTDIHKGLKLKKTVTNDRSSPLTSSAFCIIVLLFFAMNFVLLSYQFLALYVSYFSLSRECDLENFS